MKINTKHMLLICRKNIIVICIMICTILSAFLFQQYGTKDFARVNNETTQFLSARVNEIISSNVTYDENLKINLGKQILKIAFLEGKRKGEDITLENYLTAQHHVEVKKGMKIILSADEPKDIEPYYTVYNYDRAFGLIAFTAILFLVIIVIGKGKGLTSILGLGYTLFVILFLMLPMIFAGYSPIWVAVLTVILSTVITLLLLNGTSKKTLSAIIATILGVMLSAVCFFLMSNVLHLDGFSSDEAESLVLINQATGLQIKDILFAGILISSLGAIMDVGMSIVSALYEIVHHQPLLTKKELFHSGMEIGKDMIGTMTNTLILAFAGSAFISLLVLTSFQVDMKQLMNSNFIMMEFAQGIAGTLGIVLTVPIASWIAAFVLNDGLHNKKRFDSVPYEAQDQLDTYEEE